MPDFREIVKALVWQFAYRGNDDNRRWLSTGGLSALNDAFHDFVLERGVGYMVAFERLRRNPRKRSTT